MQVVCVTVCDLGETNHWVAAVVSKRPAKVDAWKAFGFVWI